MPGQRTTVLAAFGNPLLDIIVNDSEGALVDRFCLEREIAQEVDTHGIGLYETVTKRSDVEYAGGGCALNTARVFQWLSGVSNESVFLGGLGKDEAGDILETLVNKDGVLTSFAKHQDLSTGHCIALVDGAERTLCANLGAASKYETEDLWTSKNTLVLKSTKVIYVEGYFLAHSFTTTLELANYAHKNKITFVFNLCGEYVCEDIEYVENVLKILPFIDIMFGNKSEFDVFINTVESKLDVSSSVVSHLRKMISAEEFDSVEMNIETLCDTTRDDDPSKSLLVIVTEGCEPVQCYTIGSTLSTISVPVPKLPKDSIKDTIGAGDSFISGFIYAFVHEGDLNECVEYAIWTAQEIIQQVGVTLPRTRPRRHFLEPNRKKKKPKRTSSCGQDTEHLRPSLERKKIKS